MRKREQMIKAAATHWAEWGQRWGKGEADLDMEEIIADFALEQIEAAIAAEQKRVLEALEVEKRIANYGGTNYRSIAQKAIDTAIEIVKGGEK